MGASANVAEWPAIRDVTRQLDMSQPYVTRLIHSGRLQAVRTRLGWLVNPESVAAFAAERTARQQRSA
jgi:excisionase family DNA binding protein